MRLTKIVAAVAVLGLLAACGGGNRVSRNAGPDYRVASFASGPISRACLSSDRKARNTRLCGCVQSAADRVLTSSDQKMAASFYRDPHKAQVVRQSDSTRHEAFWARYSDYVKRAEGMCRGL